MKNTIKKQVITNKIPIITVLFSFILILISISGVNAASTVYVNTTGNDDTGSGSAEKPYLTISKGISSVEENGIVKIANGNYKGKGNTKLTISKNMTITGQNQKKTIINGTGTDWIFNIDGATVTIQNLTITNGTGYYFDGCGGAIYNQGNLMVENCTFTSNTASAGGAIFTDGNRYSVNIILRNCTFTGNRATWSGGAISSTIDGGSVTSTLTGCSFTGNAADRGGAIFNRGTLTANFNTFYNNTANDGSSAISGSEYDSMNVENNWWGTNNPIWENLIDGFNHPRNWVILSVNATPNSINNTKTSTITADFNHINGGSDLIGGHIPDGQVTLDIPWGSFTKSGITHSITLNTLEGVATATFYANEGAVPLVNPVQVTALADGYTTNSTESAYITINKTSDLYIKTTSSNSKPIIGETFILTYKLGNYGPDTAENVTITFQIPEGLEFVNIKVDTGKYTYNPITRTVTWTLNSVPVGDPYLYLTVKAADDGTYKIIPSITSITYNLNSGDDGIITINIQPNNNSGNGNGTNTVNAASKTTIGLQKTGLPLNYLILTILIVLGGLVPKRK